MKEPLFVDTSALYAFFNAKAPEHPKIKRFLNDFQGTVLLTNYIFDEIVTLVGARVGHDKAVLVGNVLLNSPQVRRVWISPNDEKEAWDLFVSRDDKAYSFTDCTSFVVMRRLKIFRCLALDEHFGQEGFEVLP